jgi:flavodoxin
MEQKPSRRSVLKATASGLFVGGLVSMLPRPSSAQAVRPAAGKILTVYYSRTGNTRSVAERIHRSIGGDLVEIRAAHAYPVEYRATTEQAKRELEANFRPELASDIADIAPYGTVFIGYPNWWSTLPMALFTFLERHDMTGKTIVPFCTHEGSGLGRGPSDIRRLCPDATILDGIALRGGAGGHARSADAGEEIDVWLKRLDLATAGS